jgi:hypothetical protein
LLFIFYFQLFPLKLPTGFDEPALWKEIPQPHMSYPFSIAYVMPENPEALLNIL